MKLEEGRKRKPEGGEKNERRAEKGKFQNGQNKRDTRREKFEH